MQSDYYLVPKIIRMTISAGYEAYLQLLEKVLINEVYLEQELALKFLVDHHLQTTQNLKPRFFKAKASPDKLKKELALKLHAIEEEFTPEEREAFLEQRQEGKHIDDDVAMAVFAYSMIGKKRMQNIRYCLERIFQNKVEGDVMECGVWKGGAAMYMQGLLKAYQEEDRNLWLADSFEGIPVSSHPSDQSFFGDVSAQTYPNLAINGDRVKNHFKKLDLLGPNVKFLKGWFHETLEKAPISKLALLRLDGDLYDSTFDALNALYPKVSSGGFVIIDDFGLKPCREAVEDYRAQHAIEAKLQIIDSLGAYWQKP